MFNGAEAVEQAAWPTRPLSGEQTAVRTSRPEGSPRCLLRAVLGQQCGFSVVTRDRGQSSSSVHCKVLSCVLPGRLSITNS